MAVEFKVEYVDADNARIRAFDAEDGSLIDDARVLTQQAEALAEATLAGRDAFRAAQKAEGARVLVEGARVLVGRDPAVLTEYYGQEGTITDETWEGTNTKVVRFDDGVGQIVSVDYLTVVEDADKAQEAAVMERLIEAGVRVRILDEPVVFLKGDDEPDDGVYFEPGTVATISAWEDDADEHYCSERNFFLVTEEGMPQVVAMRSTEPLDEYREFVSDLSRSVGAEFAERRGIVVGATVSVPGLEGILFGTGTVKDVVDGVATVSLAGIMEREYPVYILNTADDDG